MAQPSSEQTASLQLCTTAAATSKDSRLSRESSIRSRSPTPPSWPSTTSTQFLRPNHLPSPFSSPAFSASQGLFVAVAPEKSKAPNPTRTTHRHDTASNVPPPLILGPRGRLSFGTFV